MRRILATNLTVLFIAATALAETSETTAVWSPVCGDWEVRIDGGGEIYQANLLLKLEEDGDASSLKGSLRTNGRTARLSSSTQSQGALVVTFKTRRSGVPTDATFAFNLVDGKLVGDVDFTANGQSRSYEFDATRVGGAIATKEGSEAKPGKPDQPNKPAVVNSVTESLSLRQGVDGYAGTIDTEIWGIAPTKALDQQGTMTSDSNNGGGESQVLMKFTGLIGSAPNQVPPGCRIKKAKLTIVVFDPGSTVNMHRVLVPWDEASTWDSMSHGLAADDLEASRLRDGFSFGEINMDRELVEFDVTSSVQKWSDGESNQGWVFINSGGNGWDFYSSDWIERDIRPQLVVEFERKPTVSNSSR